MWKGGLVVRWNATGQKLACSFFLLTHAHKGTSIHAALSSVPLQSAVTSVEGFDGVSAYLIQTERWLQPFMWLSYTLFLCQHAFLKPRVCLYFHVLLSSSLVPPPRAESHPLEFYFCSCGSDPLDSDISLSISVSVALYSFLSTWRSWSVPCYMLSLLGLTEILFFCFPYICLFFLCHILPSFCRKLQKFHSKW